MSGWQSFPLPQGISFTLHLGGFRFPWQTGLQIHAWFTSSMVDHQVTVRKWTPNNALDPTAGSVSVFMQIEFTESFSYRGHAAPAVGQLGSLGGFATFYA